MGMPSFYREPSQDVLDGKELPLNESFEYLGTILQKNGYMTKM